MSQKQVSARRHETREQQPQDTVAADLRDTQLAEDVECCLAEIDCCLDETVTETEQERALREFRELRDRGTPTAFRLWQAQYAHLGLQVGISCCGTPYLTKDGKFLA